MRTKKRRVTIQDIARRAGVSVSTVSRTLTQNCAVAADKQAAILAAIDELGYRPNAVARGLASGSSRVIGVLTQHIASPFYGEILTGIEKGLNGSGYSPMVIAGNWQLEEQLRAVDVFLQRRVDSLIILAGDIPDDKLQELSEEIPLVIIGRMVPGIEHYCLHVDNREGGYLATRHLIDLGHQRIAHIAGFANQIDSVERQEGYQRAMREAGLRIDPQLIVHGDFREQSGIMALETLLTRGLPFSAVFVANDQMAEGVKLGLHRRGIRVPDEISLVGFDDQPNSAYTRPPLTTVRQPAFDMGLYAARNTLAMLAEQEPERPELTVELIVRESTAGLYPQRVRTAPGNYRAGAVFR